VGGVKIEEIEQLLAGADEEKKRMIMKIVQALWGEAGLASNLQKHPFFVVQTRNPRPV
jgi:hypothetical protein